MRTRKTLEERIDSVEAYKKSASKWPVLTHHIRAEYALLARRVKQLQRFAPSPIKGCHCQICRMHDHATGAYLNRNDVLALIKELKQ